MDNFNNSSFSLSQMTSGQILDLVDPVYAVFDEENFAELYPSQFCGSLFSRRKKGYFSFLSSSYTLMIIKSDDVMRKSIYKMKRFCNHCNEDSDIKGLKEHCFRCGNSNAEAICPSWKWRG